MVSTYPGHTATNDSDTVVQESLIYRIKDQASPNYGGIGRSIVCHLREPSSVNKYSLRGREFGIYGMATALHLRCRGVKSDTLRSTGNLQ